MIWDHKAKMHWACNDFAGLSAEVTVSKKKSMFIVTNLSTGEIVKKGEKDHPLEAMAAAKLELQALSAGTVNV